MAMDGDNHDLEEKREKDINQNLIITKAKKL